MAEEARIIIDAQLQFRHDSEAAWLEHDPVLKAGEPAYTLGYPDRFKLGDGQSKWSELPYIKPGEGGGGGGGGSQSYESLTWQAIKSLTAGDPSVLPQAFAVKQAYNELKSLIPALDDYYTKAQVNALIPDVSVFYTKGETDNLLTKKVNQSDFETLEDAVGVIDGTVGQHASAIQGNTNAIAQLSTTVGGVSAALDTLQGDLSELEGIVAKVPTTYATIAALSAETAARETWQNGINSDIGAIQSDLLAIQKDYINSGELTNAINALGVPALKTRVQNLETAVGDLDEFVSDFEETGYVTIATHSSAISGLDTRIKANATAISNLSTDYEGFDERLDSAETNITNLTNNKLNKSVWDSVFEIDANGNLKVKVGLYSPSFITARASDPTTGGGGGGGAFSLYTWTQVKAMSAEVSGIAPTAYALKQAYNEINTSLDGKASTSSVTSLTTRVASLESKATSVSVSQTLTTGTEIGKITIDGVSKALYAPSSIAWGSVTGKPSFATVATSGSYNDLSNKPTIPSIAGLASESWVSNNYLPLSGGTLTGTGNYPLIIKAGTAEYSAIRLMTSAGDNITFGYKYLAGDTIPKMFFTNKNGWNSEYILIHSGNYSSYALPLTGGTIEGTLTIRRSPSVIAFETADGSPRGSIGIVAAGPVYYDAASVGYDLLHSGNIGSQSVNYATSAGDSAKLGGVVAANTFQYRGYVGSGGVDEAMTNANAGAYTIANYFTGAPLSNIYGTLIQFQGLESWISQLALYGASNREPAIYYRRSQSSVENATAWKQIAFTDSNVASATKLATPRTIWGQSFDGTGNVSGNLTLGNAVSILGTDSAAAVRSIMSISAENSLIIGHGSSAAGIPTYINGSTLYFRYGTSRTLGMLINSSGNVTIGSSDLAGTSAKLYVYGATRIIDNVIIGWSSSENGRLKIVGADTSSLTPALYVSNSSGIPILDVRNGGNVLIGTTEDIGAKLFVNGVVKAKNSFVIDRYGDHTYWANGFYIRGEEDTLWGIGAYSNDKATEYYYIGGYGAEMITIRPNGNVLIGTTTDNGNKLQVNGSISMGNSDTSELYMNRGYYNRFIATQNNGRFAWRVNGVESDVMELSTAGHLLIGTTTDSNFHLDVSGNARVAGLTATTGAFSGALSASNLTLSSNLTLHYQIFFKRASHCYIWGASGSAFHFGSDAVGTTSPAYASLSIYSDSVTPGARNNAVSLGSASYRWSTIYGVNGDFSGSVIATGTIYSATGVYSSGYVSARGADTSSDRRLKDNIAPIKNALNYVLGTNYVSFDWKDTREKSIGIIAQEEMGREWGCLVQKHTETYSYLYGQHTALLGAALQEEDKKVEELKAEISRLKAEVKDLKTRLNS